MRTSAFTRRLAEALTLPRIAPAAKQKAVSGQPPAARLRNGEHSPGLLGSEAEEEEATEVGPATDCDVFVDHAADSWALSGQLPVQDTLTVQDIEMPCRVALQATFEFCWV